MKKSLSFSLVAAAVTAAAFAAISTAADNGKSGQSDKDTQGDVLRAPGPGGPQMFRQYLSDEDRQALEDFRSCMEDQGVDGPPGPPPLSEDGEAPSPPEPPTDAEREKMDEAFEACEDKLPEGAEGFGPGGHGMPCGPPPGMGNDEATPPREEQQAAPATPPSGSSS